MKTTSEFFTALLNLKEHFRKPFSYYRLRDYSKVADYMQSQSVSHEMTIQLLTAIQDFTESADYFVDSVDFNYFLTSQGRVNSFEPTLPKDIGTAKHFINHFLASDILDKQKELFARQDFPTIERLLCYETILPISVLKDIERNSLALINQKINDIETVSAQDLLDNHAFLGIRKQLNSNQVNEQFELLETYQKDPRQKQRDEEERRRLMQREMQRQQKQYQREQRHAGQARRHIDDNEWDGAGLWKYIPISLFLISIVGRCYRAMDRPQFDYAPSIQIEEILKDNNFDENLVVHSGLHDSIKSPLFRYPNKNKFTIIDTLQTGDDVFFGVNYKNLMSHYNRVVIFYNQTDYEVIIFNRPKNDYSNQNKPYSIYVAPHDTLKARTFENYFYIGKDFGKERVTANPSDTLNSFEVMRFKEPLFCAEKMTNVALMKVWGSLYLKEDKNGLYFESKGQEYYIDGDLADDVYTICDYSVSLPNND